MPLVLVRERGKARSLETSDKDILCHKERIHQSARGVLGEVNRLLG